MVGITLGLIIILGIGEVFVASRRGYSTQEGLSQVQQNGRFGLTMLARATDAAGDMGFNNSSGLVRDLARADTQNGIINMVDLTAAPPDTAALLHMQSAVEVYEFAGTGPGNSFALPRPATLVNDRNQWRPRLPAAVIAESGGLVTGSDVIVLRYMAPLNMPARMQSARPTAGDPLCAASGAIRVATGFGVAGTAFPNSTDPNYLERVASFPSRIFAIAKPSRIYFFQASVLPAADGNLKLMYNPGVGSPGNIDCNTVQDFSPSAQSRMGEFFTDIYYIGRDVGGMPGLYRMFFDGSAGNAFSTELLVEGIESMQVLAAMALPQGATSIPPSATRYMTGEGIATSSDFGAIPSLTNADEIQWARQRRTMGVRIALLSMSADNLGGRNDVNYQALGTTLTGTPDRRIRQVFEQSFTLRNRVRSVIPQRGILY